MRNEELRDEIKSVLHSFLEGMKHYDATRRDELIEQTVTVILAYAKDDSFSPKPTEEIKPKYLGFGNNCEKCGKTYCVCPLPQEKEPCPVCKTAVIINGRHTHVSKEECPKWERNIPRLPEEFGKWLPTESELRDKVDSLLRYLKAKE